ncbi:MAG TPA: PDZ domain-containing protein [Puia sp.]|jgi:serine protease Do|nr:PDZ domain-containing protein [Puia sp.]
MKHLLRITGLAMLALFIQTSGHAQEDNNQNRDDDSPRKYDEIVIRHKSGKDAKVTIEIKDGDVLVNGKPVSEYEDSSLSIHRRKVTRYGNAYSYGLTTPDGALAPEVHAFPNESNGVGWSYNGDNLFRSNRAMLGVATEKKEGSKGVKVIQVTKGSAAEKMGLKAGDVITRVDDEEITDPHSLSTIIGGHEAGDKVTVTFMRDGKEQKQTGELGKAKTITMESLNSDNFVMPEMPQINTLPPGGWPKEFRQYLGNGLKFGIRAQDAEDGKGVKVLDVDDESTAAKAGIKEGDVITRFDGKEVNSVTSLTEAAHAAKDKVSVKVAIIRDGKSQELEVKVPKRLRTADL